MGDSRRRIVVGCVAVSTVAAVSAGYASVADAGGYGSRQLQKDVRAVSAAAGGANVVARVDSGHGSLQARTSSAVPWNAEFRVASTTKTFTSVAALQLVADGKLSLDDTVERWLPGVVKGNGNDGSKVTVRDLLQQTSGIFDYMQDPGIQQGLILNFARHRFDYNTAAHLVAVAMRHRPLFTPDPKAPQWSYSNTNYLLAGMAIERAGGVGWRERVEHGVITPLGLRHTSIPGGNPYLPEPHAKVTLTLPSGPADATDQSLQSDADSAVVSTTADLNAFFRGLVTGRLLPPAQLAAMERTVTRNHDPDDLAQWPQGGYGLGLRWNPLSCGGGYWHHEGDGLGAYTRTGVTTTGGRAVTISITSTGALPDLVKLNKATRNLVDHALCAR